MHYYVENQMFHEADFIQYLSLEFRDCLVNAKHGSSLVLFLSSCNVYFNPPCKILNPIAPGRSLY